MTIYKIQSEQCHRDDVRRQDDVIETIVYILGMIPVVSGAKRQACRKNDAPMSIFKNEYDSDCRKRRSRTVRIKLIADATRREAMNAGSAPDIIKYIQLCDSVVKNDTTV